MSGTSGQHTTRSARNLRLDLLNLTNSNLLFTYYDILFQVMEILERNGIKIPTTDHRVGSNKRRKSENLAEARSVKIKMEQTETADSANKSLSRIHQCE